MNNWLAYRKRVRVSPNARWLITMQPEILGTHQWSFFAGLADLIRTGEVAVDFKIMRQEPVRAGATTQVRELHSDEVKLIGWEMHDTPELNAWNARRADIIFKRSFDDELLAQYEAAVADVRPMGLTIGCRSRATTRLAARSNVKLSAAALRRRDQVKNSQLLSSWWTVTQSAYTRVSGRHVPVIQEDESFLESLQAKRANDDDPYATFLVRAWDPSTIHVTLQQDFEEATHDRAVLIRLLRRELGDRFVGGFVPSNYAHKKYPDCVAQISTQRPDFLRTVATGGVAISTRGLSNSNPWKLAEYAATGTAIISEPLHHRIPEPLVDGTNVLWFHSHDECVEHCLRLLDDRELRCRLQQGSSELWRNACRPDQLLRKRLVDAFS